MNTIEVVAPRGSYVRQDLHLRLRFDPSNFTHFWSGSGIEPRFLLSVSHFWRIETRHDKQELWFSARFRHYRQTNFELNNYSHIYTKKFQFTIIFKNIQTLEILNIIPSHLDSFLGRISNTSNEYEYNLKMFKTLENCLKNASILSIIWKKEKDLVLRYCYSTQPSLNDSFKFKFQRNETCEIYYLSFKLFKLDTYKSFRDPCITNFTRLEK